MSSRTAIVPTVILSLILAFAGTTVHAAKGGKGGGKPGDGEDPPAGNPAIVYVDGGDLMVMDADGSNPRTVLSGVNAVAPNWSPAGDEIVFTAEPVSGKGKNRQPDPGLYVVGLDGSGFTKLASTSEIYDRPSWAPTACADGDEWIVFVDTGTGGLPDLFAVRPDGTGRVNLTDTAMRKERYPTWSPDASTVAAAVEDLVIERQDVLTYAIGGSVSGLFIDAETNETGVSGHPLETFNRTFAQLDWSRTGDQVAMMVTPFGGNPDVWVLDLATPASSYNLTVTPTSFENSPTWSPDDAKIGYWLQGTGVVTVNAETCGDQALLASTGIGPAPAWMR